MARLTFAELYCTRHGFAPEIFAPAVLRRALYPHTRFFAALIRHFDSDYFAADLDLVRAAGRLRHLRDFASDAEDFAHHPANRGTLRRTFRLRVSVRRLRSLLRATLADPREPATTGDGPATFGLAVRPKP